MTPWPEPQYDLTLSGWFATAHNSLRCWPDLRYPYSMQITWRAYRLGIVLFFAPEGQRIAHILEPPQMPLKTHTTLMVAGFQSGLG